MISNPIFSKTSIENSVTQIFENYGNLYIKSYINSLKNIGYYYSTISGISVSVADLKISYIKQLLLNKTIFDINLTDYVWQNGQISDVENYEYALKCWEYFSNAIADTVVQYYKKFNSLNTVFMMIDSGARGNSSQFKQLISTRGFMVDIYSNILDIPIINSFKSGLNIVEYLISSYGARKGSIDTSINTANAGYLTRKFVYLIQDLTIKSIDCKTNNLITIHNNTNLNISIYGKTLTALLYKKQKIQNKISFLNTILTNSVLTKINSNISSIKYLQIRSPITCYEINSICQSCYGWDLSKKLLISLGDAIGITTAETLGEPGTQMTMRTFHTGGSSAGTMTNAVYHIFTNKLKILKKNFLYNYQNNYGLNIYYNYTIINLLLITWENYFTEFRLNFGNFLYKKINFLYKKNDIFVDKITNFLDQDLKKIIYPLLTEATCKLKFFKKFNLYYKMQNIFLKTYNTFFDHIYKIFIVSSENFIYQILGKYLQLPKNYKTNFFKFKNIYKYNDKINSFKLNLIKFLNSHKSFGKLKIITPFNGLALIEKNNMSLNKKKFNFYFLNFILRNIYLMIIRIHTLKSQYLDKMCIISSVYIKPKK